MSETTISKTRFLVAFKKKSNNHPWAQTTHHNHKAFKAMRLRALNHLDTVVSNDDNIWYSFYHNVSQLIGCSPVLKQKLIQTSKSIQSYHTMNEALIGETLDLVRKPSVPVYLKIVIDQIFPRSENIHLKVNQEIRP